MNTRSATVMRTIVIAGIVAAAVSCGGDASPETNSERASSRARAEAESIVEGLRLDTAIITGVPAERQCLDADEIGTDGRAAELIVVVPDQLLDDATLSTFTGDLDGATIDDALVDGGASPDYRRVTIERERDGTPVETRIELDADRNATITVATACVGPGE